MNGDPVSVSLAVLVMLVVAAVAVGWIAGRASSATERRRLRWQADHDPLTGVLNRAGFSAAAAAVLAAATRRGVGVAALSVDLEGFKTVNDVHGHAAGDAVLVQAAGMLQRTVAHLAGVVGRVGGDEFAVVLPAVGHDQLGELARSVAHVLTRVYRVPGTTGEQLVPVGASVGATSGAASCGLDQLLREADRAMYAAKRSRGGWSFHGPGVGDVAAAAPARTLAGIRCSHPGMLGRAG